ncbi:zinc ribbon domain-containing protein [bacterium]|nr:zinc ribbon domain-containing protein [bacterium]
MKIGTICKHCGSYNLIYNKSCVECGAELVKFCPKCKAANFPNAVSCRKCGASFKKSATKRTIDKNKLTPPRQFVLPEISKISPKSPRPKVMQNIKVMEKSDVIRPNKVADTIPNSPVIPQKELLQETTKILSQKKSTKKVSASSKNLEPKKKIKKVKKKAISAENETLQLQLNTLQTQLNGLQQQLNILPQQLNAMHLQQSASVNTNVTEEPKQEIIEQKPKSKQKSVLPKSKTNKKQPQGVQNTISKSKHQMAIRAFYLLNQMFYQTKEM